MEGEFVSRGFTGRRRTPEELADRLPPGQYKEDGFPIGVLWDKLQAESPRVGLWLDTSQMTLAETVTVAWSRPTSSRRASGD